MAVMRVWLLHAPTGGVDEGDQMQVAFGLDPSFELAEPDDGTEVTSQVPRGSWSERDRLFTPTSPRSFSRWNRWYRR